MTTDDALIDCGSDELYEHLRVVADRGQEPLRVDKFLMEHLPNTSRARIQAAARAGFIHVNGQPVKKGYRVKPGDVATLQLDRPRHDTTIVPEDIPLRIIYEDDALLVVDKEAGMVVHPGAGNFSGTLVHAIAWHLRHDPKYDPNDPAVGLVHRIDKDTSGLLVVAKTPDAKTRLALQFFHKTSRRLYTALVWGNPADEGRIEGNIGRDVRDRLKMAVYPPDSDQGKPAVTHYRVTERFGYVSLIECRLETGRTHQIRAHLSHIGHPLFGDERYGGTQVLRGQPGAAYKTFVHHCFDLCPRQALHARTLGFKHPVSGQEMDFDSPLPADLQSLIERWRRRA
ncbi:MAG: RluA family pseudouridine synthase [Bacteroidaceae bacterium]|nr:RluA family pseudouridine synthase [Bacteroidaceae bacterium]